MPIDLNIITGEVVDSAMKVHSALGPRLLESAYKACLAFELADRGLRGIKLNAAYRIDFIVADSVIVEVKAVEKILPVHRAQLLAYLKW
jgi:GxxExxY protein